MVDIFYLFLCLFSYFSLLLFKTTSFALSKVMANHTFFQNLLIYPDLVKDKIVNDIFVFVNTATLQAKNIFFVIAVSEIIINPFTKSPTIINWESPISFEGYQE